MTERFDVVVVGARCAGSPLAAHLARRGLRVAVLDRAGFPSETPSTHVLQPCGVAVLDDLGVLEALADAGAVPLDRVAITVGRARIDCDVDLAEFDHPGLCVRRVTLDAALVDAARAAGADVRTGVNVSGLRWAGGRVAGVETAAGPIDARLVVGADGLHSRIAAAVQAPEYAVARPERLFAWGYFAGVGDRRGVLRLGRLGEYAWLAAPTDGGLYMAGVTVPLEQKATFMADRDGRFAAGIAAWPELADLLAGSHRDGPLRIVSSWHGYFRAAAGPGWALLGDAGQFKDPTPGQGISDALRHGRALADAITGAIGGTDPELDASTHAWWRWRDRDAREMHWFAADLGRGGEVSPVREQLLVDIGADAAASAQFLRVLNHDVRPSTLFTPRRLVRAVRTVGKDGRTSRAAVAREVAGLVGDEIRHARLRRPRGPRRAAAASRRRSQ